ncbi:MAG: hypothetical protein D6706_00980 [Chloroflexi bacterium]|nr:MAG: hypothetical protein D6706_00980 [Chloroflexota bacterium]
MGNYEEATRLLSNGVQHSPKNGDMLGRLGWLEYLQGNDGAALLHMETAVSVQPNNTNYLLGATLVAWHAQRYSQATQYATRLTTLLPNNAVAHYLLGLTNYYQQQTDQANTSFELARSLDPSPDNTYMFLTRQRGYLAGQEQTLPKPLTDGETAVHELAIIETARGIGWLELNNLTEAQAALQTGILLNPQTPDAWLAFAQTSYHLGNYNHVHQQLTTIQIRFPDITQTSAYLALRGWTSLRQGDVSTAFDQFTQWQTIAPQNPLPYHALGWAYVALGDCTAAHTAFQQAITLGYETADPLATPSETPQTGLATCP